MSDGVAILVLILLLAGNAFFVGAEFALVSARRTKVEPLAAEKGIERGATVRVWSKRGEVWAKALVTKRIKPMICDGKPVHVVGIPLHWGFVGAAKKGWGPNSLTPFVGDANIETPEFKAFLVNIEPAVGEAVS